MQYKLVAPKGSASNSEQMLRCTDIHMFLDTQVFGCENAAGLQLMIIRQLGLLLTLSADQPSM